MAASDVSEGEIVGDLSEISSGEDDYFENLKKLTARKLELEIENSIAFGQFADYGKENHYSNHRQRPPTKQKRLKSGSRYESSREGTRNRSYRASSVFSNYPVSKRRKTRSHKIKIHKPKRTRQHFVESALSEDDDESAIVKKENTEDESSGDEELLKLRLTALKSKQEVKELINEENQELDEPSQLTVTKQPTEEDNLRILALRSAMLKKKEFFKERKKQRMMENERPYSPSDDLAPIIIDDDAMVLSPLGSPFNETEIEQQEIDMDISNSPLNEEKETSDMDTAPSPNDGHIENDPIEADNNDEEIALRSLLLTSIYKKKDPEKTRSPTPEALPDSAPDVSIAKNLKMAVQRLKQKKQAPSLVAKSGTKTIAMILEEQKNKKKMKTESAALAVPEVSFVEEVLPPVEVIVKSAPKVIETSTEVFKPETPVEKVLAQTATPEVKKPTPIHAATSAVKDPTPKQAPTPIQVVTPANKDSTSAQATTPPSKAATLTTKDSNPSQTDVTSTTESFLFRTITNEFASPTPKTIERGSPQVEPDSSFSTITDTKNIPLLPASYKAKRSRLITSFEAVTRPVARLVIAVRAESDTDEESLRSRKSPTKKATRKTIKAPGADKSEPNSPASNPGFDIKLESFLKNIRLQQEKTGSDKTVNVNKITSNNATEQTKTIASATTTILTKTSSSLKHLPLSSQVEYEQLLQKMKVLEAAKMKRLKTRQLKRTKSTSGSSEPPVVPQLAVQPAPLPPSPKKPTLPKVEVPKKTSGDKITESLSKISQLDEAAQHRLIEKTEINYRNHSTNLMNASRQSIKLLEDNEVDMERQEKLATQIVDIERILKKYKANLNVLNQRVKVNVHKIVQSQREMIKLRAHQKNFGKICQQVGTMIRGDEYSLPEHQSAEVEENFSKIASKTEDIMKASNDQNVKSNMKLIAERVKSFVAIKEAVAEVVAVNEATTQAEVSEPPAAAQSSNNIINEGAKKDETVARTDSCAKEMQPNSSAVTQDNPEISSVVEEPEEESEVSKMIKENDERPAVEEEAPTEIKFPEIQKPMKGVLEVSKVCTKHQMQNPAKDQNVVKKIKYESPLEFLRLPKNKYGEV